MARAVWFPIRTGIVIILVLIHATVELGQSDRIRVRGAHNLFTTPHIVGGGVLPLGIEGGQLAEEFRPCRSRVHGVDGGRPLLVPDFLAAIIGAVTLVVAIITRWTSVEVAHGAVLPAVMIGLPAVTTDHVDACGVLRLGAPCHAWRRSSSRRLPRTLGWKNCLDGRVSTQDCLGGDQVVDDWGQISFPVLGRRGILTGVEDVELLGEQNQRFRVLVLELIDDALVDEVVKVVFSGIDFPDGLEDVVLPLHGISSELDLAECFNCLDFTSCNVLLIHTPEMDHGVVEEAVGLRDVWKPGALAPNIAVVEGDVEEPVELVHLRRELSCIIVVDVLRRGPTDGGAHDSLPWERSDGDRGVANRRVVEVGSGRCTEG